MDLQGLLGDEYESVLVHESKGIAKNELTLPGPDYIDRAIAMSDRSPQVMRNLAWLVGHGRLSGTYVSILPVDQGIEHSAAASFAPNPKYFEPPWVWWRLGLLVSNPGGVGLSGSVERCFELCG